MTLEMTVPFDSVHYDSKWSKSTLPVGPLPLRPGRRTWYWPSRPYMTGRTRTSEPGLEKQKWKVSTFACLSQKSMDCPLEPLADIHPLIFLYFFFSVPESGCQSCTSFVSSCSWRGDSLTCWWHFWCWDLHSGRISLWIAGEKQEPRRLFISPSNY